MNAFLLFLIHLHVYQAYLSFCSSQFYFNKYPIQLQPNAAQKHYEPQIEENEETSFRSGRRRNKYYYKSDEKFDKYGCDSSEECKCSCSKCDDPPPQCSEECEACPIENKLDRGVLPQPSVVFMPIPYLVIVPLNNSTVNGTATAIEETAVSIALSTTTTRATTPISTQNLAPINRLKGLLCDNDNEQFERNYQYSPMMKQRHIRPLRRLKPAWMPKYGIIPIPDKLAENLMSQLREIKALRQET